MHDKKYHYGGIENRQHATVKYGNVSLLTLYNSMIKLGSSKDNMVSKVFGGSDKSGELIGRANIEQTKKTLKLLGIKIIEIDAGGYMGRKIVYFNKTDETAVVTVRQLRKCDWYPYN